MLTWSCINIANYREEREIGPDLQVYFLFEFQLNIRRYKATVLSGNASALSYLTSLLFGRQL